MRVDILGPIGRHPDEYSSPLMPSPGLRCAVEGAVWIDGVLGFHVWLTVCLQQPEYAGFLDPIASTVLSLDLPTAGVFIDLALVDPTHLPFDPPIANYQGPSTWGDPANACRVYADLQLELRFDRHGRPPEGAAVWLRADLHGHISTPLRLLLGDETWTEEEAPHA